MGTICNLEGRWNADTSDVSHKIGQVTVLLFWTTSDAQSTEQMKKCEDMLHRNTRIWGNFVRIVGLNMDSDKTTFQELVRKFLGKEWLRKVKMEHYWACNGKFLNDTSQAKTPLCIRVNKSGMITAVDDLTSCNLEQEINTLFSQEVANPRYQMRFYSSQLAANGFIAGIQYAHV